MRDRANPSSPSVVIHPFEPLVAPDARVLILGTMPSPASRERRFYYGHPRNRFWPVMAAIFGTQDPGDIPGRTNIILHNRLALWDVLASCRITGASDASIYDAQPNDLTRITQRFPIRAIFTTGATAWRFYHKLCEPCVGLPATKLPSTSPANAAWHLDDLIGAYEPIRAAALG